MIHTVIINTPGDLSLRTQETKPIASSAHLEASEALAVGLVRERERRGVQTTDKQETKHTKLGSRDDGGAGKNMSNVQTTINIKRINNSN